MNMQSIEEGHHGRMAFSAIFLYSPEYIPPDVMSLFPPEEGFSGFLQGSPNDLPPEFQERLKKGGRRA